MLQTLTADSRLFFVTGDPYREEMEECVALIMDEMRRRGINNHHTLAYQSRVGPVEWLKPYTDDTIRCGRRCGAADTREGGSSRNTTLHTRAERGR